jgi:hypothetical protein
MASSETIVVRTSNIESNLKPKKYNTKAITNNVVWIMRELVEPIQCIT